MQSPTGNGQPMSDALRWRLPAGLRRRPQDSATLPLPGDDGGQRAVGLINCVEGFDLRRPALLNVHDIVVQGLPPTGHRRALLPARRGGGPLQRGCCKLTLEVLEGNHGARRAYLDFGFEGYQLDPAMGQALFMEKKLGGRPAAGAQKASHSSIR